MADAQSNIKVSIDTTEALASIKNLQRQISAFHTSMAKSGAAANAVTAQMQQGLINSINATGKFSAQMKTIKTTTESFTNSLEKNKFSLGEYFRYAGGASKSFGKLFKTEFDTINKVARENVKDLQTQYIKLGRDANGAMKAIAVRPLALDMNDLATKTMIASEKQALLNQLLKQGSTNLLNFGKNTQWAGRQLMVGFTIPLITVGSAAAKTFMDMETQAIRFKKVYGDLFTPQAETQKALEGITSLGKEFTKYGIAVSSTVGLASEAAAAGFKGVDLQNQTTAATRLSILGQVDSQKALETTIALQNAFSMSSSDLASNIDFLNAVENQTVLSLDDVTTAIPKAAPVIQQLGGDVKDLAFFMTAMKEGGINASEGANALKSGLASMINPTSKASAMLKGFGINIQAIVENNRGDLKKTVVGFATALNQLDPLNRAQAIEQMFGKFQFARLSTLFANVTKEGTQAARVLDLAGSSMQDLAALSEKELGMTADSAMTKFKASVEQLKLSLVPVGEEFLKAVTPIAEFVSKLLDKFNNLGDGTKKALVVTTTIIAGLGPVLLMTFGLLANGLANIIKGFTAMKTLFNRTGESSATLGTEVKYMTLEQRNAAAVAASLDQVHKNLAQTFSSEAAAVDALTSAYGRAIVKQAQFGGTGVVLGRGKPKKFAKGKPYVVGGSGNKDSEPSMLMPGETVLPKDMSKKYAVLVNGIIADNIPGYSQGKGAIGGSIFGTPATFSRASTATRIEATISSLNTELQALVRGAIPSIIESFGGASISVESFGKEVQKRVASGEIAAPKSALGAFGEKSYSAPAGISAQTQSMDWSSRAAEEAAIDAALKDYKLTLEQRNNIIGKDTAHIEQALATSATGEKIWDPSNLQSDSRALNKYMEQAKGRMLKFADETDKVDGLVSQVAKELKISADEVKARFARLSQGNQPQTQADYALLSGFAKQDVNNPKNKSPYMAAAAGAVADVRVKDNSYVEALAKGDVTAYNKTVKKNSKDIYVASRDRKSPHRLAAKDGADDSKAYLKASEKEAKKNRRVASRAQGPAGIGPVIPAGVKELSIVPQLTDAEKRKESRRQTRSSVLSGMKTAGSKLGTRLGGGTALLGANMALSAMPDFAGKGIIQSTMTGANMGMLFGPWGAAAGAAIGLVSSALTTLIAKEKEHKAVAEATFKASADVAKFFGTEAASSLTPISNFARQMVILGKNTQDAQASIGLTATEISNFNQMVAGLPEDNALATVVRGISNESNPAKIKETAQAFVQMQVALGQIKPEDGQKLLDLILTASGKSNMVGALSAEITTQADAIKKSIDGSSSSFNTLKLTIGQTVAAAANATSLQQLQMYLDGIAASGFNGAAGINALRQSFIDLGNIGAADVVGGLARKGLNTSEITTIIKAQNSGMNVDGKKTGKELLKLARDFNKKAFEAPKSGSATTNPYKSQNDSLTGQNAIIDAQIKALEKKKKLIDDQISAQKKITAELKRQHDFEVSQADIEKKIVEAKIRGDYLEAANLKQQQLNKAMEFRKEGALSPLEDQSSKLQDQIDALKDKKGANSQVINSNNTNSNNTTTNNYSTTPGKATGFTEGSFKNPVPTRSLKEAYQNAPQLKPLPGEPGLDPSKWNSPLSAMFGPNSAREQIKKYAADQFVQPGQFFTLDHNGLRYKFKVEDDNNITMVGKPTAIKKVLKKANGGLIKKYATGGLIVGPGTGRSDSITASLGYAGGGSIRVSNGEFIMKESAVKNYGISQMNAINKGTATVGTSGGTTVYNINMPITSNNASAAGVADEVIKKLKLEVNKNNKSNAVKI